VRIVLHLLSSSLSVQDTCIRYQGEPVRALSARKAMFPTLLLNGFTAMGCPITAGAALVNLLRHVPVLSGQGTTSGAAVQLESRRAAERALTVVPALPNTFLPVSR